MSDIFKTESCLKKIEEPDIFVVLDQDLVGSGWRPDDDDALLRLDVLQPEVHHPRFVTKHYDLKFTIES